MTKAERTLRLDILKDFVEFGRNLEERKSVAEKLINISVDDGEVEGLRKRIAQIDEINSYLDNLSDSMSREIKIRLVRPRKVEQKKT